MSEYPNPADDEEPEVARYANCFRVGHNEFEFVLVLGEYRGGQHWPRWYSRSVTAPAYAKELARVLTHSIDRYEATYGAIKSLPETEPEENEAT